MRQKSKTGTCMHNLAEMPEPPRYDDLQVNILIKVVTFLRAFISNSLFEINFKSLLTVQFLYFCATKLPELPQKIEMVLDDAVNSLNNSLEVIYGLIRSLLEKTNILLISIDSKKGDLKKATSILLFVLIFYFLFLSAIPGNENIMCSVFAVNDCGVPATGDGDASSGACTAYGACNGGASWNIGGEVDATACCGDDITTVGSTANFVITEASSTDAPAGYNDAITACCSTSTDCNYNDACVTTGSASSPAIPSKAYCSSGTWYGGDFSSAACTAVAGASRWSLGGEGAAATACCGDDNSEYSITESSSTDAPAGYNDAITACCDVSTDCNYNDACVATGSASSPAIPSKAYCSSGTWYGGDFSNAACTAVGSTWITTGTGSNSLCCGDDGTTEDFESTAGAANSACYNGVVRADAYYSGAMLISNGEMYDCGGALADDSGLSTHVTAGSCVAYEGVYCQTNSVWAAGYPDKCSCTLDSQCKGYCDNETTRGSLTLDSFDCFSAVNCGGGALNCGTHNSTCQVDAGADADCDDYLPNGCVENSGYCSISCGFSTLTASTFLKVIANQSYAKNSRIGALNLSWTDNSNGESTFTIYRSVDNITFASDGTDTASPYTDGSISDNTPYFYKLSAIQSSPACYGTNSTVLYNITADRTGPAPPTVYLRNYTTKVDLNWTEGDIDLALYLPFEEGSGSITEDWSGNQNHGTISGATWTANGKYGNALIFDGSNAVTIPNSRSLNITNNRLTIMGWIYPRQNVADMDLYPTFIMKRPWQAGGFGSHFVNITSLVNFQLCQVGSCVGLNSKTTFTKDKWYFYTGVADDTNMYLYINGILDSSTTTAVIMKNSTSTSLTIGGGTLNATLDEIRIYNRSLSQREIIDIMQSGLIKKRLYRSTASGGPYTFLGNISSNNYTDSEATDLADPGEVTALTSTSHPVSNWRNDTLVDFSWTRAVDAGTKYYYNISSTDWYGNYNTSALKTATVNSSLDGYDILCDTSSGELGTTSKDYEESQTTHTCTFSSGSSNYFHIKSKDNAGNWDDTSADIGPYYIDTAFPTICNATLINESTKYAYVSGKTIYYNTVSSGSFTVKVNATDALSGIANVTFPIVVSAGTIDTASPYKHTYDWDTGDNYDSLATFTCKDKASNSNSSTFTVNRDTAAPSGGSVTYTDGYTSSSSVTLLDGTDSEAGVNSSNTKLLRRTAAILFNNSCGTYGSWSQVGSIDPATPYTDTLTAVNCYQYRYEVYDNVWNNVNYTSANTLIYNNLPTHDAPTITPNAPNSTSNLTCNWQSSADADGSKVINITNWYRNNRSTTLLYLPFEGNGGYESTNTTDYSGYGNNGTVFGAKFNRTGGKIGGGYNFDGTDDYMQISYDPVMDGTNFSILMWFYANSWVNEADPTLISRRDSWGTMDWQFFYQDWSQEFELTIGENGGDTVFENLHVNASTNAWHHIVFTKAGTLYNIYLDGTYIGNDTSSTTWVSSDDIYLGVSNGLNFDGIIDEVKIFNLSLSASQIYEEYKAGLNNKTSNKLTLDETASDEQWKCSVTPNDGYQDGITKNSTSAIISNLQPSITTPTFTPTIVNTSTNLGCYATATDSESSSLTVYWYWFNASTIKLSGTTAVTAGVNTLITTLGAGNTTKGESWNCTVKPYDGSSFGANKTVGARIINSPPSLPLHISPTSGNTTVHDRTPIFNWSSIDIDGDDINYTINISFASTIQCGADFSALAVNSNYTPGYDFCLDLPINWTVRAFDGTNYTSWTSVWNFTIESYLSLNLTNASMNFGSLDISQTKDTESLISPFIIENNGNMMANIARISANSSLWIRQPINTLYFRFKADNDTTEKDSFTWSSSAVSWTNMTSVLVTNQTVIQQLDYKSANDTAEIDISVTVPLNEPPGTKKATVYIIGSSS